jgi:tetratricopeptide (TPR) repeat protein
VFRAQGNLEQARIFAGRGLRLAQEIQSQPDEAFLQWQMGLIHETMGEYKEAIELMEQAVLYYEKIHHPEYEKNLSHLKSLKAKLGQQ